MYKTNSLLRLALAFVFLYAGISAFMQPDMWIGFVPPWVESFGLDREVSLYMHAAGDLILGFLFLMGKWKREVGIAGAVVLTAVALVNGPELFVITFRDVGLAIASLAYAKS